MIRQFTTYHDPHTDCKCEVYEVAEGELMLTSDYNALLEKYDELNRRMDKLEK